jgi:hypothetical protein
MAGAPPSNARESAARLDRVIQRGLKSIDDEPQRVE